MFSNCGNMIPFFPQRKWQPKVLLLSKHHAFPASVCSSCFKLLISNLRTMLSKYARDILGLLILAFVNSRLENGVNVGV